MTSIINLPANYSYEYKPEHGVFYIFLDGKYINYAYHKEGVVKAAHEHSKKHDK